MNKKTKLVTLLVLIAALSVFMLSSCSLAYSGKYVYETDNGAQITLELGLISKATVTTQGRLLGKDVLDPDVKEYIYAVDYSKKVVILYKDKDARKNNDEVASFKIVSRNELVTNDIAELSLKRDGVLPSFTF
ncbi:MAG: hypothetical protein LBP62_06795 [Clostridiales bacterium]|jgi:hypothetical protein|nr:hypothetical protein [Clostridiales bacterium]